MTTEIDVVLELVKAEIEHCRASARRIEIEINARSDALRTSRNELAAMQVRIHQLLMFALSHRPLEK